MLAGELSACFSFQNRWDGCLRSLARGFTGQKLVVFETKWVIVLASAHSNPSFAPNLWSKKNQEVSHDGREFICGNRSEQAIYWDWLLFAWAFLMVELVSNRFRSCVFSTRRIGCPSSRRRRY
ncbi:hypothetical protein M0657_007204 [Pyricularia oryzae]|nr:hypothetical protein M0657_007204 [Pyricularia oryzae]KAI7925519.1 hypothetical protein M9X92_003293 [Pyricularia oryzae]